MPAIECFQLLFHCERSGFHSDRSAAPTGCFVARPVALEAAVYRPVASVRAGSPILVLASFGAAVSTNQYGLGNFLNLTNTIVEQNPSSKKRDDVVTVTILGEYGKL
jgi:hypothetical protein